MKPLIILMCMLVSSCANQLTKKAVDDFCNHSKEHQDIVMLGLTDKMFEPHSIHVHCNSEYGFKEKELTNE